MADIIEYRVTKIEDGFIYGEKWVNNQFNTIFMKLEDGWAPPRPSNDYLNNRNDLIGRNWSLEEFNQNIKNQSYLEAIKRYPLKDGRTEEEYQYALRENYSSN